MPIHFNSRLLTAIGLLVFFSQTSSQEKIQPVPDIKTISYPDDFGSNIVWAVNIGGESYTGSDGVLYQKDALQITAQAKSSGNILGTQDSVLYQSYREGNIDFSYPVDNGTYDLTLMFTEPEDNPVGTRVFDLYAENKKVFNKLDVRLARDGKHLSALMRTATGINVKDGKINIALKAIIGKPVLSGLILRHSNPRRKQHHWSLFWHDEFSIDGHPNPDKWSFNRWPAGKVNREDQVYTDRPKNARVENGKLIIEAHRENYRNGHYTSARLHSHGKGDFLYGYAEVRAKIPAGQGTWSAIWMLPSDPFLYSTSCKKNEDWQGSSTCDAWPNSGEIDIMEHVGYDMNNIHGTVHNRAYYWKNWQQRKASIIGNEIDQSFHTYAVQWSPENIIVYYDDTPYFFYTNESTGWQAWPYDHPYHIVLNLAIGGDWGRAGGPIDNSIFPTRMEVDYVRIYRPLND